MNRKKKSGEVLGKVSGKVSDNVPSKIYIVLMAVFALVFIGAALGLFHSIHGYREGDNFYQELYQDKTEIAQSGSEMPTVDFQALQAINSDVTAWLYQAGTGINYPVVQGRDNDYYLNHLLNGDKNKYGTPFIDYRTIDVFHTSMTIIYGHNMKNGAIFASLTEYKSQSYYDAHPTMTLLTPNGNYTLEIF
ncbi:MAG: class B sortase, partial [Bacillota bacterium]|nr:class B sortase [Bacillota bacterium]